MNINNLDIDLQLSPDDLTMQWDVIVIGAGMGGATLGYELGRLGKTVLYLDRGEFFYPYRSSKLCKDNTIDLTRLDMGMWPDKVPGTINEFNYDFHLPMGSGSGGSALLYAAQLERLSNVDFEPRINFSSITDSSLPQAWPINYSELEPFYKEAEILYRVRGTPDSKDLSDFRHLLAPPNLSQRDNIFFDLLKDSGLNPYRAHIACEFVEDCIGCPGEICNKDCKNDPRKVCIIPSVKLHGAKFIAGCFVKKLEADEISVTGILCEYNGKEMYLKAKVYVLSAGAISTPALLLNSKSNLWPKGLANSSGLVGKNLMWHSSDYFLVIPWFIGAVKKMHPKLFSINEFYVHNGIKLGTLQSAGVFMDKKYIYSFLHKKWNALSRYGVTIIPINFLEICAFCLSVIFSKAYIFASIIEDLPYEKNCISTDKLGMPKFHYVFSGELKFRSNMLFKAFKRKLRGRALVLRVPQMLNLNFGHACGTCRFGEDPKKSVLNRQNKTHDLDNLYVCDSSFFPSSGGVNPSLTIAANSLRVAKTIVNKLDEGQSSALN